MTKTIKVQYSMRYTGRRYSEVPKIQMEGKWLEAIGFSVGDRIHVDYDDGKIIIRTSKDKLNILEHIIGGVAICYPVFIHIVLLIVRCLIIHFGYNIGCIQMKMEVAVSYDGTSCIWSKNTIPQKRSRLKPGTFCVGYQHGSNILCIG